MRKTAVILAAGLLLLGAAACEKVPTPTSDPTPPTLNWHVENRTTSTAVDVAGTGKVTGKKGDDFRVTLTATDHEGIHKISMGGGYTTTCRSGDVGSNAQGVFGSQNQTLAPDAQNKVLTQIFLIQSVTPDTTCPGGTDWQSTSIGLNGSGTNYFNGTTTGTLTITVTP
jgi:hypothetical protein